MKYICKGVFRKPESSFMSLAQSPAYSDPVGEYYGGEVFQGNCEKGWMLGNRGS